MIFRNLNASGDWVFGQGQGSFLTNEAAVELNIATRIRSFLNDCFWALDFGVNWWNLLGTRNPNAQANIILQVREVLAGSYGVVRINSVEALTDRVTRRLTVKFNVDTIFTRGVTSTVQP